MPTWLHKWVCAHPSSAQLSRASMGIRPVITSGMLSWWQHQRSCQDKRHTDISPKTLAAIAAERIRQFVM